VLLVVGDNISTDEILPAGARVLPFRSNISEISRFAFEPIDLDYPQRAAQARAMDGHIVLGGENYGQGSSREHAVLAPRFLGLRVVVAKSFARIHWQNLVNFGVLPLTFVDPDSFSRIVKDDVLCIEHLREQLVANPLVHITNAAQTFTFEARHDLSSRQIDVLLAGGLINWVKSVRAEAQQSVRNPYQPLASLV
jgi:aconitate hydratase